MYCVAGTGGSGGSTPGTGSLPECLACNCLNDTAPTVPGRCSVTNAVCDSTTGPYGVLGGNTACPNQPGTTTITSCTGGNPVYAKDSAACNKLLFDPYTNAPKVPATTMLADSNGAGVVCRHNNQVYAITGVPAAGGLFTYARTNVGDVDPANKAGGTTPKGYPLTQTGAFTTQVTSGCPVVGQTVQIPRHYYVIDTVEFCDDRIVTANDQWRGFGAGSCQDRNDLQRFNQVRYGRFNRIDLFATNTLAFPGNANFAASATPYPKGSPAEPANRVWLDTVTPTPETSESINYANWYAYYSTRLNAGKSTSATAFSFLTNVLPDPIAYRVGFHNLGEEPVGFGGGGTPIIWLNVADWDQPQRNLWYARLFGISVSTYKTPIMDAMLRIGNLVETGSSAGLPAAVNPLPAGTQDPISLKPDMTPLTCQANFHILFTDGKNNQVSLPNFVGEQDANVPGSLAAIPKVTPYLLDYLAPLAGSPWPLPFKQGTPAVPNTLSDIATYYWARDLKPLVDNEVPSHDSKAPPLICPPTKTCPPDALVPATLPNDLDPTKDVAWWQHVQFSAISFGAEGTLDAGNQPATINALTTGALDWPDLTQPNNPIQPRGGAAGAVAVDDLWHATVQSRGTFVFARSPIEVAYGLASILAGIQNQTKSRAGVAFGGQVLNAFNNIIFEPRIEPGWSGDLRKVEINPATGVSGTVWWSASAVLANQIKPVNPPIAPNLPPYDEPWLDPTKRRVVTHNGTSGIPFQFANLTTAQLNSLAPSATQQRKMISYLRGGNYWVGPTSTKIIEGTSIGQFRKRFGALGDLSNAQPVIVFQPDRPYKNPTDPGYETYLANNAGRAVRVVAPANDGMVHVFDAGPMPNPPAPMTNAGGTEVFAYIPKALFKGVAGGPLEDPTGIQALAYQDGGVPIYRHHMYVDSSPRVADVASGNSAADWRTIVVGGLGKGGNSYYALDLTNPDAANETAAAGKVLWEWSVPEMKYSYGRPVIVKVRDSTGPGRLRQPARALTDQVPLGRASLRLATTMRPASARFTSSMP